MLKRKRKEPVVAESRPAPLALNKLLEEQGLDPLLEHVEGDGRSAFQLSAAIDEQEDEGRFLARTFALGVARGRIDGADRLRASIEETGRYDLRRFTWLYCFSCVVGLTTGLFLGWGVWG